MRLHLTSALVLSASISHLVAGAPIRDPPATMTSTLSVTVFGISLSTFDGVVNIRKFYNDEYHFVDESGHTLFTVKRDARY
ncbi:hypothetical protein C8R43DRAFT_1024405 [Mycena crocata]|nr:hypothetical protein C8R43DRAFT_1024405 [Mycena crocata]